MTGRAASRIAAEPPSRRLGRLLILVMLPAAWFLPIAPAVEALPPDQEANERLLALAGEDFRLRETDHFIIAYDTPYPVLRALTGRLEGTYEVVWRFCEGEGLADKPPDRRMGVILFQELEDFARCARSAGADPEQAAGFFDHASNLSLFSNVLSRPSFQQAEQRLERIREQLAALRRDRSRGASARRRALRKEMRTLQGRLDRAVERYNRLIIQHEASHQMLFNTGVHTLGALTPSWLVEGMACQFEVPQSWTEPAGLRRINHMRLSDLRQAMGLRPREKELDPDAYRRAVRAGKLLSLESLVEDPRALQRGDPHTSQFYAQAWSLVLYLHRERREAFSRYVRGLSERPVGTVRTPEQERAEFEAVFGPITAEMERAWLAWVLELRLDPDEAGP